MTEQEWLACTDPQKMLEFLRGKVSDRRLRLFAVACCRRIWHLLTDERSRNAVEVSEALADGRATLSELRKAQVAAYQATGSGDDAAGAAAACAEPYDVTPAPDIWQYEQFYEAFHGASDTADVVSCAVGGRNSLGNPIGETEHRQQCNVLRDIFGPLPFRPVALSSAWLTPTVKQLADTIYAGNFDRLPFLADALEDAGCSSQAILDHCRQPGEHVRGCWPLDLLLGKE